MIISFDHTSPLHEALNVNLNPNGFWSELFIANGMFSYLQACQWVAELPYKRINDVSIPHAVMIEKCGTCSTKHALLKRLADEINLFEIKLMIGIFRMSKSYNNKLESILKQYKLDYIPEAHCYLMYEGNRLDFTTQHSNASDFENELMMETEIKAAEINHDKIILHKNFLSQWLMENNNIPYTPNELWKIREGCIEALSK